MLSSIYMWIFQESITIVLILAGPSTRYGRRLPWHMSRYLKHPSTFWKYMFMLLPWKLFLCTMTWNVRFAIKILELLWVPIHRWTNGKLVPGPSSLWHLFLFMPPATPSLWSAWTGRLIYTHLQSQGCMDREFWGPRYPEHGSGEKALNGHIPNQALGGKNSDSFLWDVELLSGVTLAQGFLWFWLQFSVSWAAGWGFPSHPILPLPSAGEVCVIIWVPAPPGLPPLCPSQGFSPSLL